MTRWITSVEELEDAPDGTVIMDRMEDVAQKRGGLWCLFETAPLTDRLMGRSLPARILE